jgi:PKHD-type hydroxylase
MLLELKSILSPVDLASIRRLLRGARFNSGLKTSAGSAAAGKHNVQAVSQNKVEEASGIVEQALRSHVIFRSATWPRTITSPRFSRYDRGMYYADHLDAPLMKGDTMRSDVSVTVFLSDPDDYDGGELTIDTDYGVRRIKLVAGDCVIYPAGTRHRVETVTRGSRLVAICWVESLVRDPAQRRILFDLTGAIQALDAGAPASMAVEQLRRSQLNLIRLWTET